MDFKDLIEEFTSKGNTEVEQSYKFLWRYQLGLFGLPILFAIILTGLVLFNPENDSSILGVALAIFLIFAIIGIFITLLLSLLVPEGKVWRDYAKMHEDYAEENPYNENVTDYYDTSVDEYGPVKRNLKYIVYGVAIIFYVASVILVYATFYTSFGDEVERFLNPEKAAREAAIERAHNAAVAMQEQGIDLKDTSEDRYTFDEILLLIKDEYPEEAVYYKVVEMDDGITVVYAGDKTRKVRWMELQSFKENDSEVFMPALSMYSQNIKYEVLVENYTGVLND